ncbi:MAG TPA: two-component system response regulator CreB, partial [Polyangiales bacterium]|nr:two-component system response regulator CreB [Polyangiales bacterium]
VEDEPAIRDNIQFALESEGLDTLQLGAGRGVLDLLGREAVDLIVLDVGLPDVSGFDLLKELRQSHHTPVILLTARNAELDRVLGLEIGADDYVVKPFSPRELAARVKAVLRRMQPTAAPTPPAAASGGPLSVNADKRQISYRGTLLSLSKYEYEILATFIERPGHVFSREQLMNRVWEVPEQSLDRTVDAHIKNLRAKLRAIDPDADPIVTHRGAGYSLREDL